MTDGELVKLFFDRSESALEALEENTEGLPSRPSSAPYRAITWNSPIPRPTESDKRIDTRAAVNVCGAFFYCGFYCIIVI